MNYVMLVGRLTKDPIIKYTTSEDGGSLMARYTLAVNRGNKTEESAADYFQCVAFNNRAEFTQKYLRKGSKIIVVGKLRSGSYINKDGIKVYTTSVLVSEQEFAESKAAQEARGQSPGTSLLVDASGFMDVPDKFEEALPFE